MNNVSRRKILTVGTGSAVCALGLSAPQLSLGFAKTLKSVSKKSGKVIGMYATWMEMQKAPIEKTIIENEFDMLADGNDLKMDHLRPTPTSYDFTYGDNAVSWALSHKMLVRGHCLVWHNALPKWFQSYVNPQNARQIMTDHITTVMKHYAGRIYAWDVVNEPIHNDSPDGLRLKPWGQLIGFSYIPLAFQTAAVADPKAKLVINENTLEHDNANCASRRAALLNLVTKLKSQNVPLNAVGIQSHISATEPLATAALKTWLTQLQGLGLEIMITELDVNDTDAPQATRDQLIADRYAEYLDLVGPFCSSITFEAVTDTNNYMDTDPTMKKRADGATHAPNLFNSSFQAKPAFAAVRKSIAKLSNQ